MWLCQPEVGNLHASVAELTTSVMCSIKISSMTLIESGTGLSSPNPYIIGATVRREECMKGSQHPQAQEVRQS